MKPRSIENPRQRGSNNREKTEPRLNENHKLNTRSAFKESRRPRKDKRENAWNQKSTFQKAMEQFQEKKEQNRKEREDRERIRKEKAAALERYKKEKREKFAKLSKKTRKGQPVMKHRMDMLLERIKNTVGSSSIQ